MKSVIHTVRAQHHDLEHDACCVLSPGDCKAFWELFSESLGATMASEDQTDELKNHDIVLLFVLEGNPLLAV